MKKVFSYILFVMICSICFLTSVKAEETYSCKYYLDVFHANEFAEENRIEVTLQISGYSEFKINGTDLIHYSAGNNKSSDFPMIKYTNSSDQYINFYFSLGDQFAPFSSADSIKYGECPILKYNDVEASFVKEKNAGTMIIIGSTNSNKEMQSLNEAIVGEKTRYKMNFDKCSAFNYYNCDGEQVSIYVDALSNGRYSIGLNNVFKDAQEESEIVWQGNYYGRELIIRQKEWDDFKNTFKYDSNNETGSNRVVKVTEIKEGSKYVISVNDITDGISESINASTDYSISGDSNYASKFKIIDKIISSETGFCVDYLGSADEPDTVASYLQTAYTFIKIGSIILVVVFSMVDFAGAITSDKTDVKKTAIKWVKRLVAVLIILLLPTFIDMIGNILNIEDILCGIK